MSCLVALGLGAIGLLGALRTPQDSGVAHPSQLAAAVAALGADSIDQAIKLARRYTWQAPRDPRGFIVLGDAYSRRMPAGRFRALDAYRAAQRLARTDPEPPYRMAQIGVWLGGDDGERIAREGLERVIALDPLYRDSWDLWLTLYRNGGGRRKMVARLAAHRDSPIVRARIALLLIEDEAYADADRMLAAALATDSTNPAWLALSAQSGLEAGDTAMGLARYRRALAHAGRDSGEALWRQVIGIATSAELRAWPTVPADQKGAWLESFWARRTANLFAGVNGRIVEHFARLRHARKRFPLLHPLVSFHRNALARALSLEPSEGERAFHLRCEVYTDLAPSSGLQVRLPGVSNRREAARVGMGALAHLTPEERESVRSATESAIRVGRPLPEIIERAIREAGSVAQAFAPPMFAALGFDLRSVDSTAARVGYNLATGLDDRGLMYLRFGPPDNFVLGGDNSLDPQCASNELERWRYAEWGEVRFSRPSAFSRGLRTTPEMVFRPMDVQQFETMKLALTRDAPSEPAPLEFGVWMAHFRHAAAPTLTDVVVVATRGEVAATMIADTGGAQSVRQASAGYVTLTTRPGRYALVAHAREADTLGRQTLGAWVRGFGSAPALSDLLVAAPWPADTIDRDAMLRHLRRDLTFRAGESVRIYAEVYSASRTAGQVSYRVTYRLLKTEHPARDAEREDWLDATAFAFDRARPAGRTSVEIETLDVDPRYLRPGTYLLRVDVHDLNADNRVGRSTIALIVR